MNWMSLHVNPITAMSRHPNSIRAAIKAKCYACRGGTIFDPQPRKSVISRIRSCADYKCPLIDFARGERK